MPGSPRVRWQTWRWQGHRLGLKFQDAGTLEQPRLHLTIHAPGRLEDPFIRSLLAEVTYRYNLALDLRGFYGAFAQDLVDELALRNLDRDAQMKDLLQALLRC
jgi:hypothetical protein